MKITVYHRESGKIIEDALLQYKNNKYVLKVDGVVYRLSENDPKKRLDGLFIDCLFSKDYVVFFNERKMSLIHYDELQGFVKKRIGERRLEEHGERSSMFAIKADSSWCFENLVSKYHNRNKYSINQAFIDLVSFIENILNIPLKEYGTKVELSLKYGESTFLQMIEIIGGQEYYQGLVQSTYGR